MKILCQEGLANHAFAPHIGIRVFGGRGIAWVREGFVDGWSRISFGDAPRAYRCINCGEQGYGVPA